MASSLCDDNNAINSTLRGEDMMAQYYNVMQFTESTTISLLVHCVCAHSLDL